MAPPDEGKHQTTVTVLAITVATTQSSIDKKCKIQYRDGLILNHANIMSQHIMHLFIFFRPENVPKRSQLQYGDCTAFKRRQIIKGTTYLAVQPTTTDSLFPGAISTSFPCFSSDTESCPAFPVPAFQVPSFPLASCPVPSRPASPHPWPSSLSSPPFP